MSIFDTLKNAIFGSASKATQGATPTQVSANVASTTAAAPGASSAAPGSVPAAQVDIDSVLSAMATKKPEKLNWQSSIVDLMKLVDLDPSLENRKALAGELGYTGNIQDSASMNTWLHRQVMQRLAADGGKVPDSLRH